MRHSSLDMMMNVYTDPQLLDVAVPRSLFRALLERIRRLRPPEAVPG